jgi:hypothetical protein
MAILNASTKQRRKKLRKKGSQINFITVHLKVICIYSTAYDTQSIELPSS